MHVTLVHVHVEPESLDDFIEACRLNHQASIQEPGNRRFDVLQMTNNPSQFVLYEAYENAVAADDHKQSNHYFQWRDTVADMMAEPRQGIAYKGLFPRV